MPTEADTRWAIDRISKLTLSITVTGDDHQILFGTGIVSCVGFPRQDEMPNGFKAGESRLVNRGDLVSFAKERRSKAKRALMSRKSRRVARGITRGNPRRKVFECRRNVGAGAVQR
ncbi:hypothetical protein HYQ46_005272 [Verticillium longisporum]|nr:hypothetical protein HYQ46_005272 [Verticillium longisporum]